jgi:hypothetical protein
MLTRAPVSINRSFVDIARLIRSPRQAGVKELGACTPIGAKSVHTQGESVVGNGA